MKPSRSFIQGDRARQLGMPIGSNPYDASDIHWHLFRAGWELAGTFSSQGRLT